MKKIFMSLAALLCTLASFAATQTLNSGSWSVSVDDNGYVSFSKSGTAVMTNTWAYATYVINGASGEINTSGMARSSCSTTSFTDKIGDGERITAEYTNGTVTLTRIISVYDEDFVVVQATLRANNGATLKSNRIDAVSTTTTTTPFTSTKKSMICVPFDNDDYDYFTPKSISGGFSEVSMTSHEVGYVYDNTGTAHGGFVLGSIDHDKWKSGITISGKSNKITKVILQSGFTNTKTRDGSNPHGYVHGTTVESARYFVGVFTDWRNGMNLYAEVNTRVVPSARWNRGNPFGWSSWGALKENVDYTGANTASTYIESTLKDRGFYGKDGNSFVSLDSHAEDKITGDQLKQLSKDARENRGQRLGLYGGLAVWKWCLYDNDGNGSNLVDWGIAGGYYWRDVALLRNGKPIRLSKNNNNADYYAIDPTHPAVKQYLEDKFRTWAGYGVKYMKFDFLSCASCEGDSWYDPNITTGIMAYNYAMKMVLDLCEKYDMYLLESISPIFPYQYAHGRRTCCDAWDTIKDTELAMNAITWGWWTDKLYTVNDADHLVMGNSDATTSLYIRRARATSGVCTGAFIFGDDLSNEKAKTFTETYAGNADVNEYVRNHTGSFMPVGYTTLSSNYKAGNIFYRIVDNYCYVAVFSYTTSDANTSLRYDALGLTRADVSSIKELWTGENITPNSESFTYKLGSRGYAKLYRLELNRPVTTEPDPETVNWQYNNATDFVKGQRGAATFADFNGDGRMDLYYCGEGSLQHDVQPSTFKVAGLWDWQTQSNLYINRGDGSFEPRLMQHSGTSWTSPASGIEPMISPHLITLDYDNDGALDLLVMGNVNGNEWTGVKDRVGATFINVDGSNAYAFTALYHNDGTGHFTRVTNTGLPNACTDRNNGMSMMYHSLAVGDIDHDGFTDVAMSYCDPATYAQSTRIVRNNHDGTFTALAEPNLQCSGNVHLVDLNNDGWLDLAVIGEGASNISGPSNSGNVGAIFINNEGQGFTNLSLSYPDFYTLRGGGTAFADLNEDGYLDLINLGWGDNNIAWACYAYLNTGDERVFDGSNVNLASRGIPQSEGWRIIAADFNGDGHVDLQFEGDGNATIYFGDGKLNFKGGNWMQTRSYGANDGHCAVGDITGNGLPDIFHLGYVYADEGPGVNVFHGSGGGWYWSGILWENQNASYSRSAKRRSPSVTTPYQPTNVQVEQTQVNATTAKLKVTWDDNNLYDPSICYNVVLRNNTTGKIIATVPTSKISGKVMTTEERESAVRPGVEEYTLTITDPGSYTPGVQALCLATGHQSEVQWADNVTGVEEVSGNDQGIDIRVSAGGGVVTLYAQSDLPLEVYDLAGRLLATGVTNQPLALNISGVVLIRCADTTLKVKM